MTDECIAILGATTLSVSGEANFVSFITNGVRINWANPPSAARLMKVTFFAGTDVDAQAGTFALPNILDGTVDINTV
jgi:hypothetical protein